MVKLEKRPVFILEIVIAIVLVGFFSIYFIDGSLKHLKVERKALLALEFAWQSDLKKMEILENSWPHEGAFVEPVIADAPLIVTLNNKTYQSPVYQYSLTVDADNNVAWKLKLHEQQLHGSRAVQRKTYYFFAGKFMSSL